MKRILLYILFMIVISNVNGQTYYKLDYSGNASGNNIQMEVEYIISATNISRLEFSLYEPFSYGHDNVHNSQTIQNYNVHPAPGITYSDGNRKTYIYTDINAPSFTFRKTYNATTNVNLGLGFYSHDTYPVTSVPAEYLMATDSIQADNVSIVIKKGHRIFFHAPIQKYIKPQNTIYKNIYSLMKCMRKKKPVFENKYEYRFL